MTATPLLWHEHDEKRWTARVAGIPCDTYSVKAHLYARGEWACQWRETPISVWIDLGHGGTRQEAMVVAHTHHAARMRRLAWERYMKENDPPIAPESPRVGRTSQP